MDKQRIVMDDKPFRIREWQKFSDEVLRHIEEYTIPQFGDFPNDQVTEWTPEDVAVAIKRYIARFRRNSRGEEENFRDMLKIAHYACMAWTKMIMEKEEDNGTRENKTEDLDR